MALTPLGATHGAFMLDVTSAVPQSEVSKTQVHRPQFLSVPEALKLLGISRTTLYGLLREGLLHPVKLGRRTLFVCSELESFMLGLPRGVKQ